MKTERNYLFEDSFYLGKRINGQWDVAAGIKLEELISPNQKRLLLTLEVYSPYYDGADPDHELVREILFPEYTRDSTAIRKAIEILDNELNEYLSDGLYVHNDEVWADGYIPEKQTGGVYDIQPQENT